MSYQIPLVFEIDPPETQPTLQRLQPGNDLDIPINDRVALLEIKIQTLTTWLVAQGFELPENLLLDNY